MVSKRGPSLTAAHDALAAAHGWVFAEFDSTRGVAPVAPPKKCGAGERLMGHELPLAGLRSALLPGNAPPA